MLNGTIDLHLHSTCSDGKETPEELIESALADGYETISITDHDTVAGIPRAVKAAERTSLEVIPGIELSSVDGMDDVHILGYFIDYTAPEFQKRIEFFKEKRRERADEIVHNLNQLGLDIQINTVLRIAHGAPIGRPHIAEALLSEELVTTYGEAFNRYIGQDGPAYVPKYKVEPEEAINLIHDNGGVSILAHPGILDRDELIFELKDVGLMGIEAIHPFHVYEKQVYYEELARNHGLLFTGGSDWHGRGRSSHFRKLINARKVPRESIDAMKTVIEVRKRSERKIG